MKFTEIDFLNHLTKITEVNINLTLDTKLNNTEIFDSLALMSIAAWCSDTLKKNISVTDLEKIDTIDDLLKLMQKNQ
jgi:acyl carrier protein